MATFAKIFHFTSNERIYQTNVPENEYFLRKWGSLMRCKTTKFWHGRFVTSLRWRICYNVAILISHRTNINRENRTDSFQALPLKNVTREKLLWLTIYDFYLLRTWQNARFPSKLFYQHLPSCFFMIQTERLVLLITLGNSKTFSPQSLISPRAFC